MSKKKNRTVTRAVVVVVCSVYAEAGMARPGRFTALHPILRRAARAHAPAAGGARASAPPGRPGCARARARALPHTHDGPAERARRGGGGCIE